MLLVLVAGCGGGSSTSTSAATSVPTTLAPSTSAATTTTSPPDTTASVVVPAGGFEPACVDLDGTTSAAPVGDPALEVAALLAEEPVVQLELPTIRLGEVTDFSRVRVWRIPGGMLVELRPYMDGSLPVAALFAIDADGSVRWRRCLDRGPDLVAVAQSASSTEMIVGWATYDATGPVRTDLEVWSLADGSPSRTWDDVLAANGISGTATDHRTSLLRGSEVSKLVLGPVGPRSAEPDDTLVVVDLATMAVRELPYPQAAVGGDVGLVQLEVTADGRLFALDPLAPFRVAAVETASGWSADEDAIDAAVGVRANFFGGVAQQPLSGYDSQRREVWRRDDMVAVPFEGFELVVDGDVVVASSCAAVDMNSPTPCDGWMLSGLDLRTGQTLWERPGIWSVSAVGGGVAMVAGPYAAITGAAQPEWTMIDVATGEQLGTRSWTEPWSFGVGCCDEPAKVYRSGGVVFTVDGTHLEMWYPEPQTTPLQTVKFG